MARHLSIFEELTGACFPAEGGRQEAVKLTEDDILEIRSLYHPPAVLRRLLEAVYWLLMAPRLCGRPPSEKVSWMKVQAAINSPSFTQRLWNYDISVLRRSPQVVKHLNTYYFGPSAPGGALKASAVRRASEKAGVLFHWAAAKLAEASGPQTPPAPVAPRPSTPASLLQSAVGTPTGPPPAPCLARSTASSASAPNLLQARPLPLQLCGRARLSPRGSPKHSPPGSPTRRRGHLSPPVSPTRRRLLRQLRSTMPACKSQLAISATSLADVACLRTIVIVAGRWREVTMSVARSLFQMSNTLVLVLVHGAEEASLARWELRELQAHGVENSRLEVERFDIDSPDSAAANAKLIMARYPSIKGLMIDAKALPQMPPKWATEYEVSWALRGAAITFEALRPFFAAGARVLVLSNRCGANGALKLSKAQHSKLFHDASLDECGLEEVASEFQADLADATERGRSIPCKSTGGWWLDKEAFSYTILHSLVGLWHRRHMRLVVCLCACRPQACLDREEAHAATAAMAKPPSASKEVAGRLISNGAEVSSWLYENDLSLVG